MFSFGHCPNYLSLPQVCPFYREKKLTHYLFWENELLMRETNFTLGPIQKSLYLLLLYQFHLPKIGQNLISAGHWDQYITHYITLNVMALGMGPSVKHVSEVL